MLLQVNKVHSNVDRVFYKIIIQYLNTTEVCMLTDTQTSFWLFDSKLLYLGFEATKLYFKYHVFCAIQVLKVNQWLWYTLKLFNMKLSLLSQWYTSWNWVSTKFQ